MNNLNKKQKIIVGIVIAIVAIGILYYVYGTERGELISFEENIENVSSREEKLKEEVNVKNEIEEGVETESQTFTDTQFIVYITGEVKQEGVYGLAPNSRIADAIEKAGGLTEEADISQINLAYVLEDGMKVRIPNKNEKKQTNETELSGEDKTTQLVTTSSGTKEENNTTEEKQGKININTATQEQLENLPGVGPSTASKIIAYRKEKGKFSKIEEIKEVSGIGESKFAILKDLICVK